MGKRLALVLVCVATVLLLFAPSALAAIGLTGMNPASARSNQTFDCTVSGSFATFMALTPQFELAQGGSVCLGTTTSWDSSGGTWAKARFSVPGDFPQGWYSLTVTQVAGAGAPAPTYTAVLDNALLVAPPIPSLSSVDPPSVPAGAGDLPITVTGRYFVESNFLFGNTYTGSVVYCGNTQLQTVFVSSTALTATVPASLLTVNGTRQLTVRNITDGTISNTLDLVISTPSPTISALTPSSAVAGGPAFTLGVAGTNFRTGVSASQVFWNGAPLATTYVSVSHLTAAVPAALISGAGTPSVMVRNGSDGGSPASNLVTFTVTAGPGPSGDSPVITGLDPGWVTAGGADLALRVTGSNFVIGAAGSSVLWNGSALATTRDSSTHLSATVPAALTASAGTATVTVRKGNQSGDAVSNAVQFAIVGPGGGGSSFASVYSVSPAAVWAGCVNPGVVLAVLGANFANGAHVWLDGVEKPATSFVSASRLTLPLTIADMATSRTVQVGAKNPGQSSGLSGLAQLHVLPETTDPVVTIEGADSSWHNTPVTLTFSAHDGQSGIQSTMYRGHGASSWTSAGMYTVPTTAQGEVTVEARALDWCDRSGTANAIVKIDTTPPVPRAVNNVVTKRKKIVELRYRVTEPPGLSDRANVTIVVKRVSDGATMWTVGTGWVKVNTEYYAKYIVRPTPGKYRWYVYATDLAGNTQVAPSSKRLIVLP